MDCGALNKMNNLRQVKALKAAKPVSNSPSLSAPTLRLMQLGSKIVHNRLAHVLGKAGV
jgi:hypothetical protein